MSSPKIVFGFHATGVRLRTAPQSVIEVHFDASRRDARMRQFLERATEAGVRLVESDGLRLSRLCGSHSHQGVAARVQELARTRSLDELLEQIEESQAALAPAQRFAPLLLVLDGVTDPHNLGACLRVADGAGAHAVIAPKDHAAGINATVAKVASGAADTVPYFMVTNLARTLNELKERAIWVVGTSDAATTTLYQADLTRPTALVLGAEGAGMRQLTAKTCDELVQIPMRGAVESLNVSVASGICLYEAVRQRAHAPACRLSQTQPSAPNECAAAEQPQQVDSGTPHHEGADHAHQPQGPGTWKLPVGAGQQPGGRQQQRDDERRHRQLEGAHAAQAAVAVAPAAGQIGQRRAGQQYARPWPAPCPAPPRGCRRH